MRRFFPVILLIIFTIILFRKMFLGFVPVPFDLLVTWFFPYSQGGWQVAGTWTSPKGGWYASDTIRQIYPWKELAIEMVKDGKLPFWNPYNFSGSPLLANMQTSIFYPLNIIFLLIPSFPWAWAMYIALPILIGGIFMYKFLKELKLRNVGALFGALAFSSSGYMISWLEWGVIPHAMMWLPLSLLAINNWFQTKEKKYILLLIFSLSSTILAGYPQGSAYSLIIVASYFIFNLTKINKQKRRGILIPILLAGLLTLGVTAIQWIPTMELFFHSAMKGEVSQTLSREASMPLPHFATLLAPDYYGNRTTENYWAKSFSRLDYMDANLFVGVVTLPFALLALFTKKKRKETKWFALIALLGLLLGAKTPISATIARLGIPVIGTGAAAEALVMLIFATCGLGAIGLDQFMKKHAKKSLFKSFALVGVLFSILLAATFFFNKEHALISRRNLVLPLSAFFFSIFLVFVNRKIRKLPKILPYLFILILAIELILHANKILPFSSPSFAFPEHILIEKLRDTAKLNRIAGFWETEISTNFHTALKLYSSEGYDPLYIRRYGEFITSAKEGKLAEIVPRSDADITMENEINRNRLLDLASVKYIPAKVTNPDEEWEQEPLKYNPERFKLVWQQGNFKIYENLHALPRALLYTNWNVISDNDEIIKTLYDPEFSPRDQIIVEKDPMLIVNEGEEKGTAIISNYESNLINIKTESSSPSILLLTDSYFPGWNATVDNEPSEIIKANYTFRSIVVPKGQHTVTFRYQPISVLIGKVITGLSFFIIFLSFTPISSYLQAKFLKK